MTDAPINTKYMTIFMLALITIGQMAVDIYLPSMPHMVHYLHTSERLVQETLTFYLFGFAFSQLLYGPLSDHFGRRPILFFGCIVFIIGCLMSVMTNSIYILLASRVMQGLGIGAASVVARALMRDVFEGDDLVRVSSYMAISWALIPIIAPLLGGYIQHYFGWHYNFVFLTGFTATVTILAFFKLPETLPQKPTASFSFKKSFTDYHYLFTHRAFISNVASMMLFYGVFAVFNIAGPFLLQNGLGYSAVEYSWIIVIIALGYISGSFATGKLVKYYAKDTLILIGNSCFLILSSIMAIIAALGIMNIAVIAIPMFFIFIGMGLSYSHYIYRSLSPFPQMAGSAGALLGFLIFLGGTMTSSLMAHLPETTQLPLAITLTVQAVLIFGVFMLFIKTKNNHRS